MGDEPNRAETGSVLAHLLRAAHDQSKLPGSVVAGRVGISESYFSKLLNGHRCRPSRDLLLALGYVWGIQELDDIDRILEAAGHPKLSHPIIHTG
jgi:hypothetical protein